MVAGGFSHEHFEEFRAFVPPMPVEFGVIRRGDMGCGAQDLLKVAALRLSIEVEVSGVIGGAVGSPIGNVGFFSVEGDFARDSEEFEPCIASHAVGVEVGAHLGIGEVEPAVAVEFAVIGVAGVSDFGALFLPRRFEIAGKGGDAAGRDDGAERAVSSGRIALCESVGFEDEESNAVFGQEGIDSGDESAFG